MLAYFAPQLLNCRFILICRLLVQSHWRKTVSKPAIANWLQRPKRPLPERWTCLQWQDLSPQPRIFSDGVALMVPILLLLAITTITAIIRILVKWIRPNSIHIIIWPILEPQHFLAPDLPLLPLPNPEISVDCWKATLQKFKSQNYLGEKNVTNVQIYIFCLV